MLETFGALYAADAEVDLRQALPAAAPVTTLPTAPWQRSRYWYTGDDQAGAAETGPDVGRAVAEAFAGVLRVVEVPSDASFFELGGTSLMAAQIPYELRARLGRDIPLRLLLDHLTSAGLTEALKFGASGSIASNQRPLTRSTANDFPLSFNQERVVRLDPRHYPRVIAQHLLIAGPLDFVQLGTVRADQPCPGGCFHVGEAAGEPSQVGAILRSAVWLYSVGVIWTTSRGEARSRSRRPRRVHQNQTATQSAPSPARHNQRAPSGEPHPIALALVADTYRAEARPTRTCSTSRFD